MEVTSTDEPNEADYEPVKRKRCYNETQTKKRNRNRKLRRGFAIPQMVVLVLHVLLDTGRHGDARVHVLGVTTGGTPGGGRAQL